MTLTANQQIVQDAYQNAFGRDASFGTLGGADYWTDQIANNGLDATGLAAHLAASAEGQTVQTAADGTKSSWIGGVNPNASIAAQQLADSQQTDPMKNTWASHFSNGGALSGDLSNTMWADYAGAGNATNATTNNVAQLLNNTYNANNPNSSFSSPYYNNDPLVTTDTSTNTTNIPGNTGNTNTNTTATGFNLFGTNYADMDALKDALGLGSSSSSSSTASGGMDEFMKFMMLMSVMPRGGGGGGYGGGQYGYGGMNPGGVQSAYNPWANMQQGWDFMQNAFGSGSGGTTTGTGSGATTGTVNAT